MMRQDRFMEGAQEVLAESQQLVRTERRGRSCSGFSPAPAPAGLKALQLLRVTPKTQNYKTNFEVAQT